MVGKSWLIDGMKWEKKTIIFFQWKKKTQWYCLSGKKKNLFSAENSSFLMKKKLNYFGESHNGILTVNTINERHWNLNSFQVQRPSPTGLITIGSYGITINESRPAEIQLHSEKWDFTFANKILNNNIYLHEFRNNNLS